MDPIENFKQERSNAIKKYAEEEALKEASQEWLIQAFRHKYMYNFSWADRPIIQLPTDILVFQEIVWSVKPDLIIETGIAHGGSLMLSASMLALLDYCEAIENGTTLDPSLSKRKVLGIDIEIRAHNKKAIAANPLAKNITMIEGSSISPDIVKQATDLSSRYKKVLVCLDSMHTHDHVLAELENYGPLVSEGSYCLAFDTIIEDLPNDMFPDRPWTHGNNTKTAVHTFIKNLEKNNIHARDGKKLSYKIDQSIQDKMLISAMPDGILKRM